MTAEVNENDDWKNADFLSFDPEPQVDVSDEDDDDNSAEDSKETRAKSGNGGRYDYGNNDSSILPPWMDRHHHFDRRRNPLLVSLHNEILQFYNLMKPRDYEVSERMKLVEEISQSSRV